MAPAVVRRCGRGRSVGSSSSVEARRACPASTPGARPAPARPAAPLPDREVRVLDRQRRQGGRLAAQRARRKRRPARHEQPHRPAVGRRCGAGRAAARGRRRPAAAAAPGPAGPVAGRTGGAARPRSAARPRPRASRRQRGQIVHRAAAAGAGGDHLCTGARPPWRRSVRSASCRSTSASSARRAARRRPAGRAAAARAGCCTAAPPGSGRRGTTAAAGRTRAAAARPGATGAIGGPPRRRGAASASRARRAGRTVGALEQRAQGDSSTPEHRPDPGRRTRTARIESPPRAKKSSSDADPLHAEHLGPDRGQRVLDSAARRHVAASAPPRPRPARAAPAGRACRSGVSGSASSATNAAGHHVRRAARRRATPAARRRRVRARAGDHVADQPLVAAAVLARDHGRLARPPGWPAQRAPRSRPARPGSRAPSPGRRRGRGTPAARRGASATRSPVRYIRAPGGPNGSATNRSRGQPGPVQIAAGQPGARRRTARPGTPTGTGRSAPSSTYTRVLPDRPADRRGGPPARSGSLQVAHDGRLGRPVRVDHAGGPAPSARPARPGTPRRRRSPCGSPAARCAASAGTVASAAGGISAWVTRLRSSTSASWSPEQRPGRRHHQRRPGRQRHAQLQHGGVEARRGELQHPVARPDLRSARPRPRRSWPGRRG